MTLKEAINYFESLESTTTKKSELAVISKFIQLLNRLENRDLSASEIQAVEQALGDLSLKSDSAKTKRYFNKALLQFQKQIKETLSLTPKGYYTNLGVGLGASFGVLFGIVVLSNFERSLGISFGISIGMVIGLVIGHNLDAQARASGKMI